MYSRESVPELTYASAGELASRLDEMLRVEVPRVTTWLAVLGQNSWIASLSVVAIGAHDLRTCAEAWEELAEWRKYFEGTLTLPLVKLKPRDGVLDDSFISSPSSRGSSIA